MFVFIYPKMVQEKYSVAQKLGKKKSDYKMNSAAAKGYETFMEKV